MCLAAALAGCAPLPVERAEASCLRDAELASGPRGQVTMGVAGGGGRSSGAIGSVELNISSDYLMGRDPSDVFNRCVLRRSGQMPTRSLADQPGWRG
ncbi:hypothetical protein [Paracoccus spongiarum]|uniref:Lipoprotein n=1 Tax=Paracoccus spongiarum TaxID=3064387 RepID=A0ABT9JER4_9RHOB|nr:hypothetical protein [Paracoccus sp. 2205BS29-5]MDP5308303.1 hypothetical protein [Paracoccus sp. 2205BS29-5]